MKRTNTKRKFLALFLTLTMCIFARPKEVHASESEWEEVEETFTVENIRKFIPDIGFATAVYDDIRDAIENDEYLMDKAAICDPEQYTDKWPEMESVEEIIDSGVTDEDLVKALLENYCGPINAQRRGIKDITGFLYLKNATSVDFQYNLINDLSSFTNCVVGGNYNFNSNPIHIWPVTFPNTVRAATHSISTMYTVTTQPLAYRFGEDVIPTVTYNVYYPNKDTVNTDWYTKGWMSTKAFGDTIPEAPQANGTNSMTFPALKYEGSATLDIGLTGLKQIEDLDHWQDNLQNAITYISGMSTSEQGGTSGQGNSVSYGFGIQTQRYATVEIDTTNLEITGGFTFTKKSETSDEPVAGAEYSLYSDKECTVLVGGPYKTNTNGVIQEGGFTPGTYYLKETKAPVGYSINANPVKIEITESEVTTSLTGGVESFNHDDVNPRVTADWSKKTATTGVWIKNTGVTLETAETYGADALLTNKGNIGYQEISELKVGPNDSYDIDDLKIVVTMGGEKYGEYTSEQAALEAINTITKTKKLTGDITIQYSGTYKEKLDQYSGEGEQKESPLPVYVQIDAEKSFKDSKDAKEFSFTLKGEDESGTTINQTKSCTAKDGSNGYVIFDALKFTKEGTYTLTLNENVPEGTDTSTGYNKNNGITYDILERTIKITVEEKTDGLEATVSGFDTSETVLKAKDTTNQETGETKTTASITKNAEGKETIHQGSAGVQCTTFKNTLKTEPKDPGDPSDPGNPDDSGKPGDTDNPGNPDDSGKPGDTDNPGNPDDTGKPGDTDNPGNPDDSGKPGDTDNPGNPDDSGKPGDTDNPGNPDHPGKQGNISNPTEPTTVDTKTPNTGDAENVMLYLILTTGLALSCIALFYIRKKDC